MKLRAALIIFLGISITHNSAFALEVGELLLDRLVEKGAITREEAASIRADTAIKTQEELSLKKKFSLEGKTKIELSGYLQAQYAADEAAGSSDTFKIRRARLDFKGEPSKTVSWRIQLDAVQPLKTTVETISQSTTTKNITAKNTKTATRPVLLDAYIDYDLCPYASFRVGQFYVPFGRENTTSDSQLDTINRSQLTEKLVPGRDISAQGRDVGLQVGGNTGFGTGTKLLEYSAGVFNGTGMNVDDENEFKDLSCRFLFFPLKKLSAGISLYSGKTGGTGAEKSRAGIEITYISGNISFKTEGVSGRDSSVEKSGWYAQAAYKLIPELEAALKYDTYDPDTNTSGDRNDILTLGVNFFINKNAKLQLNYEQKNEETLQAGNNDMIAQFQIMF